jgi:hypothetical protein
MPQAGPIHAPPPTANHRAIPVSIKVSAACSKAYIRWDAIATYAVSRMAMFVGRTPLTKALVVLD